MAFLQIKSTNPDISYVLLRNPSSGMQIKSIRKGLGFGYYDTDTSYNVYFKDSETEVSYKSHPDESFEYMNKTRYNSPVLFLNILSEFFHSTVKKYQEKDVEGFENSVVFNMLYLGSDRIVKLVNYMEGFEVVEEPITVKNSKITIKTNKTMRDLLNFTNLFLFYAAMKSSGDYLDMEPSAVAKYIGCLDVVDPPYFVRYIMKLHILQHRNRFNKYKDLLEKTKRHDDIKMYFGNTSQQRRDWVKKQLGTIEREIVDVGCGEGYYAIDLASKMGGIEYHAVDINEECRDVISRKAAKRQLDNVKVYDNQANIDSFQDRDVLFVEVMEHMPMEDATNLAKEILKKNPNRLILTTPNKEFNVNYSFDQEQMRHDDHHFELTKGEFQNFVDKIKPLGYNVTIHDIGDCVNGVSTTVGAVFVREL